ncbi:helix-turn-helix domain-containing protein [Prevotella sp. 10(H)]|uniref:helix-turn-helix domain-containing protein n=1 Tax=Prevotella sp. 10(H) TaxID=1158294 RepID=UPI000689AF5B|nr:helix-turn-helix domain-containing protein [Prevotella sp. 10(H)]
MDDSFTKLNEIKDYITGRFDKIDNKLDKMIRNKSILDGDELIDNQDLCYLLGVTKRTVQRYRQLKLIPFYKIDKKVYYRKSDVMEFFQKHNTRKKDPTDD